MLSTMCFLAAAMAALAGSLTKSEAASNEVALAPGEAFAEIVALNEVLADPPPDAAGDANGDGVRDSAEDEFVEIYNMGSLPADLSGWTIQDLTGVRHEFEEGFTLAPGEFYVVFGGGTPTGIPSRATVASTGGLSLNNTLDEVKLVGADAIARDVHPYAEEANADQSLIRYPDGDGGWTRPHDAGFSWNYSAGLPNENITSVDSESWGAVKARYRD
jgi:hypothetical protein